MGQIVSKERDFYVQMFKAMLKTKGKSKAFNSQECTCNCNCFVFHCVNFAYGYCMIDLLETKTLLETETDSKHYS
jgi:hypothetical protein